MLGKAGALLNPETAFSPAAIPGLVLWLVGNKSPLTMNGGTISQWDDLSGNGNHASQGTAVNQPTYVGSGIAGLPAAQFDDSNDLLTIPSAASVDDLFAGGGLAVVVLTAGDAGSFDRLFDKTKWGVWLNSSLITFFSAWTGDDGTWTNLDTLVADTPTLVEIDYNQDAPGNDAIILVNGGGTTSQSATPTLTVESDAGVDLSFGNAPSTFSPWNGSVAEIALYSSAPSTANRSILREHLAVKYGITLS